MFFSIFQNLSKYLIFLQAKSHMKRIKQSKTKWALPKPKRAYAAKKKLYILLVHLETIWAAECYYCIHPNLCCCFFVLIRNG